MYTLRTLFGLDICSVCGSYQCPYCPYYAHGVSLALSWFLIGLLLALELLGACVSLAC